MAIVYLVVTIGKNLAKHKTIVIEFSLFFITKYNDSYILICVQDELKKSTN
jgi:hypothetical protein